jgi:hypothetical protein
MTRKRSAVRERRRSRFGAKRMGAIGAAAVVLVAFLGVMARGEGYEDSRMDLAGGGAWLASAQQGWVTLIDGPAEQVVGSVAAPGTKRGDAFSVIQAGASAYVANDTQGTVSRVDGGTYQASEPVRFGGTGGGGSFRLFAGGKALYVVDGLRRTASVTDPLSLRVRDTLSLTAQPGPDQSVVDNAGRLWVIDRNRGGLTWFDGGKQVRPEVGDARSRLVLVKDRPVLVDVAGSRLGELSSAGTVESWSCLEVRAGDDVQLLGSATSSRVYAAVSGSGMLVSSTVGRDDCGRSVAVGKPGDKFGPLVEASGYVLVPNRTSGRTIVVDMRAGRVAADLAVVKPGSRLELLAKDGFVFYNDIDGDQAGVIRFDAGEWKLGRSLKKYDKSDTGRGILAPGGDKAQPNQPPTELPGKKDQGPSGQEQPPQQQVPPQPPGQPPPPPPPPPPGAKSLTVEVVGAGSVTAVDPTPIDQQAGVQCPSNASCVWNYPADTLVVVQAPENVGGAPLRSFDGCQSTESVNGNRRCTLTLSAATTVRATYDDPPPPPKSTLTVTPQGNGTVEATPDGGPTTQCNPECAMEVNTGTRVTMRATPAPDHEIVRWSGVNGCGQNSTCVIQVDQDTSVAVEFRQVVQMARLTVTIGGSGDGTVSGQDLRCNGNTCTGNYPVGTDVHLTANPDSRSDFGSWTNCSPANAASCTVTINGNTSVRATFNHVPDTTPPNIRLSGGGVTVTPTSGSRTVNISGGTKSVRLTATGTDTGSTVTKTEILFGFVHGTCENLAGTDTQDFIADGFENPVATSNDGSVSFTAKVDFCPDPDFPTLVSADGYWKARATSEGGTSDNTDQLNISYTR